MSALLIGLLVGAVGGWVACDVLVTQRVKHRAEWWLRAYMEGQQPARDVRRPW